MSRKMMSFLSNKLPKMAAQLKHRRNLSTTLKLSSVQNPFADSDVTNELDTHEPVAKEVKEEIVMSQEVLKHRDYFDVEKLANLEDLYKNRCHFGHYKGNRNELVIILLILLINLFVGILSKQVFF